MVNNPCDFSKHCAPSVSILQQICSETGPWPSLRGPTVIKVMTYSCLTLMRYNLEDRPCGSGEAEPTKTHRGAALVLTHPARWRAPCEALRRVYVSRTVIFHQKHDCGQSGAPLTYFSSNWAARWAEPHPSEEDQVDHDTLKVLQNDYIVVFLFDRKVFLKDFFWHIFMNKWLPL